MAAACVFLSPFTEGATRVGVPVQWCLLNFFFHFFFLALQLRGSPFQRYASRVWVPSSNTDVIYLRYSTFKNERTKKKGSADRNGYKEEREGDVATSGSAAMMEKSMTMRHLGGGGFEGICQLATAKTCTRESAVEAPNSSAPITFFHFSFWFFFSPSFPSG